MVEPCTCSRPMEDYGLPSCPREDECYDRWAQAKAEILGAYGFTMDEMETFNEESGLGPASRAANKLFEDYRDIYLPFMEDVVLEQLSEALPEGHTFGWVDA